MVHLSELGLMTRERRKKRGTQFVHSFAAVSCTSYTDATAFFRSTAIAHSTVQRCWTGMLLLHWPPRSHWQCVGECVHPRDRHRRVGGNLSGHHVASCVCSFPWRRKACRFNEEFMFAKPHRSHVFGTMSEMSAGKQLIFGAEREKKMSPRFRLANFLGPKPYA
jgi:hypothetical protein